MRYCFQGQRKTPTEILGGTQSLLSQERRQMKLTNLVVLGAALLIGSPVFATTYLGGFEDTAGSSSDYDYNDLVFSLSGSSLSLHTTAGKWLTAPSISSLNTQWGTPSTLGTPFWNNPSWDGSGGYSIGSCVYGGGACNGGVGLMKGALYLATPSGGSVNDVYFSSSNSVAETVTLSIAATTSTLGWELVSGVGGAHYFASGVQSASFNPGGDFYLIASNARSGLTYASNAASADGLSHMAFFTPSPEPSTIGLLGMGLMGAGLVYRRKKA